LTDWACHAQDDNALTGSIPASWMTGQNCFKSLQVLSLLLNKLNGTLPQPSSSEQHVLPTSRAPFACGGAFCCCPAPGLYFQAIAGHVFMKVCVC
jgi:hypothetical protein